MIERWNSLLRSPWSPWVVALVAISFHSLGLWGDYAFDDFKAVLGHPAVTGEVPWWEVFTRDYWGNTLPGVEWSSSYRPLTSLSFALEHRLSFAPWLHHLGNLGLYALLCAAVTHCLRRFSSPRAGFLFGVLFALAPIHVENVANITGRADVLAALCGLMSFVAAVPSSDDPPTWKMIALSCFLYICGLLCKESIALFPGLVVWFAVLQMRRKADFRQLRAAIALGTVGLVYIGIRQQFSSVGLPSDFVWANNLLVERHGVLRVWGNLSILGHYAELTFVPLRLCVDHTFAVVIPPETLSDKHALWAWLGLAIVIGMLWDGWRAWYGRSRGLLFATLLTYVLVGQWIIDLSVIVAERIALWPSIWLTFALANFAANNRSARTRILVVLVALLLGLYAARTVHRTLDWKDTITVHRSSLEQCPESLTSRQALAIHLSEQGDVAQATWQWAVVASIRNGYPEAMEGMLEAERTMPLETRLTRIPEIWGSDRPDNLWISIYDFLTRQGAHAEAELIQRIGTSVPVPASD